MTTHDQVCDWLKECGCRNVRPVNLAVGSEQFIGAAYDAQDKALCDKRRYYFIGPIPKCRRRRQSLCFTFKARTMYLAMHCEKQHPVHSPFGLAFMLMVWDDTRNGPIDAGERYVYHRVPISITRHRPKAKAK